MELSGIPSPLLLAFLPEKSSDDFVAVVQWLLQPQSLHVIYAARNDRTHTQRLDRRR